LIEKGEIMSCANCPHFKKNELHKACGAFAYGCSASLNGLTFWTTREDYFAKYGCDLEKNGSKQMSIFDFIPKNGNK